MSLAKNDQILTSAITDKKLAFLIQKILRQEYKNQSSAVKRIGKKTGIELRAIRDWYEGRKPPKSTHLLILACHYPQLLPEIMKSIGQVDLWAMPEQGFGAHNTYPRQLENVPHDKIYSARSCTINVTFDIEKGGKLNQRQLWFLGLLQQGYKVRSVDIMAVWKASARAAKYDIEGLVGLELIRFIGSRKTGYYEAT
jgi:hypothetical protein